jgi:hypothetical protein
MKPSISEWNFILGTVRIHRSDVGKKTPIKNQYILQQSMKPRSAYILIELCRHTQNTFILPVADNSTRASISKSIMHKISTVQYAKL